MISSSWAVTQLRMWSRCRIIGWASPGRRSYQTLHVPRNQSKFLKISEEVQDAVNAGKPVVALETTIYTHGFPYPDNVALASRLESIVRLEGGVPATIGVLNGIARIGMGEEDLIELASSTQKKNVLKVSRRDIGYICGLGMSGNGINGGTTIAGTMVLAHLAGIKVFASGGLGGVHRGGENSMDISADLTELGRTPVAVISSGCKSFLDLQRTLEYLETQGVVVGAFADGRKGPVDFPAFLTRNSGIRAQKVIQDEMEAAAIIFAQSSLGLSSGLLFANPVPSEHSIPKAELDAIIAQAVHLADSEGVYGSDNTPFILDKIKELSGGRTVEANKALVEYNVKRGTKVAVELAKLEMGDRRGVDRHIPGCTGAYSTSPKRISTRGDQRISLVFDRPSSTPEVAKKANILVAGALAVDFACDYSPLSRENTETLPTLHTSNPSAISQSLGGVGYNVALAANYAGSSVLFCSIVADDLGGHTALDAVRKSNLLSHGIQVIGPSTGARTAQYVAVNNANKDLMLAMADMSIMEMPESNFNFDGFWNPLVRHAEPKWAVIDGNWSPRVIARWIAVAREHGVQIAFEPVSVAKSRRLFDRENTLSGPRGAVIEASNIVPNHSVDMATPNHLELASMHAAAGEASLFDTPEWWHIIDALGMPNSGSWDRLVSITTPDLVNKGIPQQSIQLLPFIPCILTKLGSQGALLTQLLFPADPRLRLPNFAPNVLGRAATDDSRVGGVYMRLFPAAESISEEDIASVNGAGDTLLGVIVAGLAMESTTNNWTRLDDIIPIAQQASVRTLKNKGGVSSDITVLRPLLERL